MSFSPYTMGCPAVGHTSTLSAPASRSFWATNSAVFFTSAAYLGSALTDGKRSNSNSSSKNRCSLSDTYCLIFCIIVKGFDAKLRNVGHYKKDGKCTRNTTFLYRTAASGVAEIRFATLRGRFVRHKKRVGHEVRANPVSGARTRFNSAIRQT